MKTSNPDLKAALDQRLNDALASANYRITLNTQKNNALIKLHTSLTYSTNGGTFNVNHELISFANALLQNGKQEAIFIDVNNNPIEINNLRAFFDTIVDTYYAAVNDYFVEIKSINKSRSPKALVGE